MEHEDTKFFSSVFISSFLCVFVFSKNKTFQAQGFSKGGGFRSKGAAFFPKGAGFCAKGGAF